MEARLLTVRELSQRLGYRMHQIKHAIDVHRIEPHQRAGIVKLFHPDQLAEIRAALTATAKPRQDREVDHV